MNGKPESRIIGGMFGLVEISCCRPASPPFLTDRSVLLANARSGINLLIQLLLPDQVWLPSYLCDAMLAAVDGDLVQTRFYEVDGRLTLTSLDWLEQVQDGDLVILIDYFGFLGDPSLVRRVQELGAWVLEDACQALLSEVGRDADFVLFSPRKFLGVPDGGILVSNCDVDLHRISLVLPPADWWLKAFRASVLRWEFDRHGGKRHWFELFREVEAHCPVGNYAMSELSELLLEHSFDYPMIAQRRIENYQVLGQDLGAVALFPELPVGVVPLGFPIRVGNRDQVRQALFDREIYPPVHWPIEGIVPASFGESHRLAAEIMTLPCDQRYDHGEMKRMAQIVLSEVDL